MKKIRSQMKINIHRILSYSQLSTLLIAFSVAVSFGIFTSCTALGQVQVEVSGSIVLPPWAPVYDNIQQVHYYYFPDIECYYDVWHHEFVYLEDGEWMFGATLPPEYSWFDLNTAFVVVLNPHVYQPWMHFHYYVAHYPRYYYRTVYKDKFEDRDHPVRGFNEGARTMMFNDHNQMRRDEAPNQVRREENQNQNWQNNKQNQQRQQNNQNWQNNNQNQQKQQNNQNWQNNNQNQQKQQNNQNQNQQNNNPNQVRQQNNQNQNQQNNNQNQVRQQNNQNQNQQNNNQNQVKQNNNPSQGNQGNNPSQQRRVSPTRAAQPMQYYGKSVGQPVKVKSNMKMPKNLRVY